MKPLAAALVLCLSAAAAAPTYVFPSPEQLMRNDRWFSNTSGTMNAFYDQQEKAIRFDVKFSPKVDKWIYPRFLLTPHETLNGSTALHFDLKITAHDGDYKGCVCGNLIVGKYLAYTPPATADTWQSYTIALKDVDNKARNSFLLGLNPKNFNVSFYMKNIRFEGTPVSPEYPPQISTDAPGTVFFTAAPLVFNCNRPQTDLAYTVKDWLGNTVQDGIWPDQGKSPLTLQPLPHGYYTLTATSADLVYPSRSFAIIPSPDTRVYPKDSFYAIDTAQSWLAVPNAFQCPWYSGDTYRLVSDLVAWAGFPHIRERLTWNEVNPKPGVFSYGRYMTNANLLKERHVSISGMFHDAPAWTGRSPKLPHDLVALYDAGTHFAKDFGDRMDDWEFWNEQDIGFAPESAWDYTACLKAACLGFKTGRPQTIAAPGALCAGTLTSYHDTMYLNDAAKYTEILNYHTYATPSSYAGIHKELRTLLDKHGMTGRAVWITECGTNQEGHTTTPSVMPQFKAHTPEQELLHAEFYPKSQVYHQMAGCARNFFFVFPPYNEAGGLKDWGTMRRDGSVKPAYTAMSTMLAQLVSATIVGECKLHDAVKTYLFAQPDQSQTLIFWLPSRFDGKTDPTGTLEVTLLLPDGTYTLVDMMGATAPLPVANGTARLTASRYPAYISGLHGLTAAVPAVPAGTVQPLSPAPDEDLTVIIRADLNAEDFAVTGMKSIAELNHDTGRLHLEIWNLENTPKSGSLDVAGGILAGLPDAITLPARGKAEYDVVLTPNPPKDSFKTNLVITGRFNGKAVSRFTLPVNHLSSFLKSCEIRTMDWLKPECWIRNTSATSQNLVYDEAEKALRWDVSWDKPVDKWFYPVHELKLPEESFKDVLAIEFEVKTSQNKVENNFNCAYLMLVFDNEIEHGVTRNLSYAPPMNDWELRRVMFDPENYDTAGVKLFRLGANPAGTKLTYWLRNIRLLYKKH